MDRGWGLAPTLSAPNPKHITIQIITKLYSGKNHYSGAPVEQPFPRPYLCLEVAGSILADYKSFNQCPGDMWRPLFVPRHQSICHHATCQETIPHPTINQHLPCVIQPYQLSLSMCRTDLPCQHSYGLYGLYNQHIFFCLFDDLNRTRYLSHPTSV
jgi:hypothetical protein